MGFVRLVHLLRTRDKALIWYLHNSGLVNQDQITVIGYVHRFAVKSTLAGSIVYYSVQEGLWSKSEDSVQLYGKVYNNVAPYVKDNIPKEVLSELPPMLNTSELCNSAKSTWNKGVIASMKFLSETPTYMSNGMQSLSKTIGQYAEQQSAAEKSQ